MLYELASRAGWSGQEIARALTETDHVIPCVEFVAESEICPTCAGRVERQKSKRRKVVTYQAGVFEAKEIRKKCTQNSRHPIMVCETLTRLVKPRQRYGYDLIVYVGLARYVRGKQRQEIKSEMHQIRNISLSDGTISNLCNRFLFYLEALHLKYVPALRQAMQGGYPLHLDATSEHGKGGLFVCMDGWRGWVLMAVRIPSEHEDYLRPLVEKTVESFGDPIATVRDMGEGGAKAVAPLRAKQIPDLICHYHFLAAVGKKLFEQPYRLLTNLIKQCKVQRDLRTLLRQLRQYKKQNVSSGFFGPGPICDELLALVLWLLEGEGRKTLLYPFSLPRLELFQRCQQTSKKMQCWLPNDLTLTEQRVIKHIHHIVKRFEHDKRFNTAVIRLQKGWAAFCELREILQLSNSDLPNGDGYRHHNQVPAVEAKRLTEITEAVDKYKEELIKRLANNVDDNTADIFHPAGTILKYFEKYGEYLFGHPALRDDENGSIIAVVERTNNVPEHFFGTEKRKLRRRVGRAHLGRDLEDQPAQAALVKNLTDPKYVSILCGSLDNLDTAFASLSKEELEQTTPLSRNNRDSKLFHQVRKLIKKETIPRSDDEKIDSSNHGASKLVTAV